MTRTTLKMAVFKHWRLIDDRARMIDLWRIAWREIDDILRPAHLPDVSVATDQDVARWADEVRRRLRQVPPVSPVQGSNGPHASFQE